MQKSERLYDMLIYLNDKKTFNLKNIMQTYSISKSTALRDIASLEEIGMPIYSKPGRNGYYGILQNRLLSPIIFTVDEVQALYFSMQTLKAYQSTPFHLSMDKLKRKFESCISADRIIELQKIEEVFSLGSYYNKNECPFLKDILYLAIDQQVSKVCYIKKGEEKHYIVQFFHITSAYGQWYATSYNFETLKPQVFRCDRIQSVEPSDKYCPKERSEIFALSNQIYRQSSAVDFKVGITAKGADIFYKEHYPSMELQQENGEFKINGFFNEGEEDFIANYFIMYGENMISVEPDYLKTLIVEKSNRIHQYLSSL